MTWAVSAATGEVDDLHRRSAAALTDERVGRALRLWHPTGAAVVLGSSQAASVADPASAAVVVRRRSGGGAVYVAPGQLVWADLVIPAGDPHWSDDVTRAFWWAGEVWAEAVVAAGVPAASVSVHRGLPVRTEWSSLVCFGGLGAGEVTVDGRKVVGLAQRRSRAGAVFQGAALLHWEPEPLLDALCLGPQDRLRAGADLRRFAAALPVAGSSLEAALEQSLASPTGVAD